jgi:subtilisin family serine protease
MMTQPLPAISGHQRSSAVPSARIEPDLLRRLTEADGPDQMFPVDFVLKAQANALDLDAGIAHLPKPERRARVGRVLMDFAQANQQDLLSYLRAREAEGEVEDISPLWIVNSIGCWATRDVISEVAQRSDVELIYYDRMPCELGAVNLKIPPVRTDGIPPNMVVTNVRGAWKQGYHGEDVVLGVVDTGVRYTHLDLRNHLWTSSAYPNCGFNFASSQYSSGHPGPSTYDTLTPLDYYGHGTHVAGVATADGTYGNGVHDTFGIAPATKIMSLPVDVYLHSPYPDTSMENNIMAAFQFCIRPTRDTLNGADAITTSLGLVTSWQPRLAVWRMMEENVLAAGLAHAVAAGNEGVSGTRCPGSCPPPWRNPANHPTGPGHERDTGRTAVITVGATDNNDSALGSGGPTTVWGNVPPWYDYEYPPGLVDPDVMMPGESIPAPYYSGDRSYTWMSGTSMATPGAAGTICLMLSKDPHLTPREIDSIIELYAVRDLGEPGKDNTYGAGRIDCSLAVAFTPATTIAVEEGPTLDAGRMTPVPTLIRGVLELAVDSRQHTAYRAELLDISGRKVLDLKPGPNDVSRLAPGVYFVRSADGGGQSVVKIVVWNHR